MDLGTYLHFDISIYATLYLIMLFVLIIIRKEIYSVSNKLILWIIASNIMILIIETITWVIEGEGGQSIYVLSYLTNSLLFAFVGLIVSYWMSYIDYLMHHSKERLQQRKYYLWVALLTIVFVVVNLFVPILFEITENNEYTYGFFFDAYFVLFLLLFLYSVYIFTTNKTVSKNNEIIWVIFFFLGLVFVAGIIQTMIYGIILIWPVMALATSITYIFFETTPNNRDYVTKLYTRIKADQYITHLRDDNQDFAIVMMDLDNYKDINDTYGHLVGDDVLRVFAKALEKVFSEDGMVIRFGGDEFMVVLPDVDENYLDAKKSLISHAMKKDLLDLPVNTIEFSYGYSFSSKDKTIEQTIVDADNQMYKSKAENKNFKRRKTD